MEMTSFLDRVNKRYEEIEEIAGKEATVESKQIAELYIENAELRKGAYEDIQELKQKIVNTRWMLLLVVLFVILM
jgi:hypothetical protein